MTYIEKWREERHQHFNPTKPMVQFSQILVFMLGVAAFWFAGGLTPRQRIIGATFGLAGQPFWFIITISAHQWFVMLLCCFYTFTWARMLWNNLRAGIDPVDQSTWHRSELVMRWFSFKDLWRRIFIHVWYFKILGRRRAIRKDEDCEFYVRKNSGSKIQPYECWGDGHYECKSCLHFKPEPIEE